MNQKSVSGFTLLELMITMAIIAIIASFAIPTYFEQIRKGARSDAQAALLKMQMDQEIWRAEHRSYTNKLGNNGLNYTSKTSSGGNYVLSVPVATTYTYKAAATAQGDQAKDKAKGKSCKVLTIDSNNNRTPKECWQK